MTFPDEHHKPCHAIVQNKISKSQKMKHHYTNAVSIELKELISDLLRDQLSSRLCNFIYRSLESPTVKFLYMQFHRPEIKPLHSRSFVCTWKKTILFCLQLLQK